MKIMVGVPTSGYLRNASFLEGIGGLRRPNGSINAYVHGQSPARNRNEIIRLALQHDCTHILFVDDDTCPPPDMLEKLIAHDKDMVTGVLLKRDFPHHPILFYSVDEKGNCGVQFLHELPGEGLIKIVNCGLGCVLIKTDVFRTMEPFVAVKDTIDPPQWITIGQVQKDHWADDIDFFNRALKLGFELYVDLSIQVGHMGQIIITPEFKDGNWLTVYNVGNSTPISMPCVRPAVGATV